MATIENHQTLVPYEPTKDCSMGFCSIYCHHWCYLIFPPPPPIILSVDDEHSRRTFSPLVIAVVGILVSAFLLVSYYAIISKYCGTCNSLWRLQLHGSDADEDGHELHGNLGQSSRGEALHVSPPRGLDQALIDKIMLCKYKRGGDGLVEGSDCSICLGEFREDESLRLLPKCSHAFHLQCIDTWLKSHSNCPLCRADIVIMNLELPAPPAPVDNLPQVEETIEHNVEMGQLVREDNSVIGGEDEESQLSNNNIVEISPQAHCNLGGILGNNTIVDTRDYEFQTVLRRSSSMGSLCCRRDSKIRDVLQVRMEEELAAAKENGFWSAVTSSSTGCREEHVKGSNGRNRSLHCVTSPVLMKRSFSSSGRFFFSRHGRGRNAILPM